LSTVSSSATRLPAQVKDVPATGLAIPILSGDTSVVHVVLPLFSNGAVSNRSQGIHRRKV